MGQHYRGRLIDHVHLRVSDLSAAKRFYKAVLSTLGGAARSESDDHLAADELWIDRGDIPSRVHLAFQAADRETVRRFHAAALGVVGGTTVLPASGPIIQGTMRPSCSTQTAITSRLFTMGRLGARPRRW